MPNICAFRNPEKGEKKNDDLLKDDRVYKWRANTGIHFSPASIKERTTHFVLTVEKKKVNRLKSFWAFAKTERNQQWLIHYVRLVSHKSASYAKFTRLNLRCDEDLFVEMSTANFWVLNLLRFMEKPRAEKKWFKDKTLFHEKQYITLSGKRIENPWDIINLSPNSKML